MQKYFSLLISLLLFPIVLSAQQYSQAPNMLSFETNDDMSATFRFYAPNATSVKLGGDLSGEKSEKSDNGIWTITTRSNINPGVYRYYFEVDGIRANDPRNKMVADFRPMVEIVPKGESLFWQEKNVPHGAMSMVYYYSETTQSTRRMMIWTPPTYFNGTEKLPVLYLMHGGGDNDTNWPGQGKAGWILDNLFSEGKMTPMVVVMPDGSIPVSQFAEDLGNDIIPYIESHFRVYTDTPHRAIAGLSMGGLETMEALLKFPDKFAYVNVMSSGWFLNQPDDFKKYEEMLKSVAPTLQKTIRYFIFTSGGPEDIAYQNGNATRDLFAKYGIKFESTEMPGGHTMYVWRHDLFNFAQKIFKQ